MDQVIQVCGRDYARAWIEICGTSAGRLALSQEEPALLASQATGECPLISPQPSHWLTTNQKARSQGWEDGMGWEEEGVGRVGGLRSPASGLMCLG